MAYTHIAKSYTTAGALLDDIIAACVAAGWEVVKDMRTISNLMLPSTAYVVGDYAKCGNTTTYPNLVHICTVAGTTRASAFDSVSPASLWNHSAYDTGIYFMSMPRLCAVLRFKPSYTHPWVYVTIGSLTTGADGAAALNNMFCVMHGGYCPTLGYRPHRCGVYNDFSANARTFGGGAVIDICADSTTLYVGNRSSDNLGYYMFVGTPSVSFMVDTTRVTADVAAGSNVTIPVLDSSQFLVGKNIRFINPDGSYREVVRVISIPNSTSIVVDVVSGAIVNGAYIGSLPFAGFCNYYNNGNSGITSIWEDTFTANKQIASAVSTPYPCNVSFTYTGNCNAINFDSRYILFGVTVAKSGYAHYGLLPDSILYGAGSFGDVFGVGQSYRGAVGAYDGGTKVITDNNANFAVDSLVGKRVAITSGSGSGQSMKIVSNTATTITVSSAFAVAPSTNSYYAVCAATYRRAHTQFIGGMCIKEDN